jgi:hypothetical protein
MKTINDSKMLNSLTKRIELLNPNSIGLWGKMNMNQMLDHLKIGMDIPIGNIKAKRSLLGFLFGKIILKKSVNDNKGLKKNLPTDKSFVINDSKEFNLVKTELLNNINTYVNLPAEKINNQLHPFFGKLTYNEWGILIYKHINHHLEQFGV